MMSCKLLRLEALLGRSTSALGSSLPHSHPALLSCELKLLGFFGTICGSLLVPASCSATGVVVLGNKCIHRTSEHRIFHITCAGHSIVTALEVSLALVNLPLDPPLEGLRDQRALLAHARLLVEVSADLHVLGLLLPMGGIEDVVIGALLGADGGHIVGPAVHGPACFGRSSGWHDLAAAVLDLGSERVGARSSAAVGARSWW